MSDPNQTRTEPATPYNSAFGLMVVGLFATVGAFGTDDTSVTLVVLLVGVSFLIAAGIVFRQARRSTKEK